MSTDKDPKSLEWFKINRKEIYAFCCDIIAAIHGEKRNILIKAAVKSGKKDMVECLSLLFGSEYIILYITALNRKDVKLQKEELKDYHIHTHLINSDETCKQAILDVNVSLYKKRVCLCIDECDYGSGVSQKMAPLFDSFVDNENVVKLYFSASAYETESSKLKSRTDYTALTFIPPKDYYGAKYFIEEDLVKDADTFFEKDEDNNITVTAHACNVIRESITCERHIGVVRVEGGSIKSHFSNRAIKQDIEKQLFNAMPDSRPWKVVPIDAKKSFDWEHEETQIGHTMNTTYNYLFVIVQTCTRGTDLKGWHHRLAFWHDARSKKRSTPNALIQAFLRPSHYGFSYGGPQRIHLYVDKVVIELAAYDDMDAYIKAGGKPPSRTRTITNYSNYDLTTLFDTDNDLKDYLNVILTGKSTKYTLDQNKIKYRGKSIDIYTFDNKDQFVKLDIYWGINKETSARRMPIIHDGVIKYIGIYDIKFIKDSFIEIQTNVKTTKKSMYSK